ncbi:MAG: hypothetical protein C4K60_07450 [Ideonella sp. MAG2]|nr:MAG: hypothetical protein C4K60_07450 [Ideonella sp. MAG2]
MVEPWRAVIASRSLPPGMSRGFRLSALVLAVLWAHGVVLQAARLPPGALVHLPGPTPVQVLDLLPPTQAPLPAPSTAQPRTAVQTPPRQALGRLMRAPTFSHDAGLQATLAQGAAEPLPGQPPSNSTELPQAQAELGAVEEVMPQPAPSAASLAAGRATPAPAVAVPQAMTLLYAAQRGAAVGQAQISWQAQADERYEMNVRVDIPGSPAIDWWSWGQRVAGGLAPERMVEQQRQKPVRAVNFQRDKGLISFSGNPRTAPLSPQAQDRASWLVQVWAWARALPEPPRPGQSLSLAVAGPRGGVDDWTFEVQPALAGEVAGHRVMLTPLVRSTQRPYDLRVTVWLSADAERWPAGVSWGVEPGGVPLVLWLSEWPHGAD